MSTPCLVDPYPTSYLVTLRILALISLPINCFGLYCVILKTPKHMKDARLVLFVFQIGNFGTDLWFNTLLEPVVLFPLPFGEAHGLISLFWKIPIDLAILLSILLIVNNCAAFLQTFHFRLNYILPNDSFFKFTSRWKFIFVRLLYYIIFDGLLVAAFFIWRGNLEEQQYSVFSAYPCAFSITQNPEMQMLDYFRTIKLLIVFGCETIFIIICSLFMLALSYYYLHILPVVSEKTHRLQKEFQLSLLLQAFVPLALVLIPSIVFSVLTIFGQSGVQSFTNTTMALSSIQGSVSAIIMLIFNGHYRRYILRTLTLKSSASLESSAS